MMKSSIVSVFALAHISLSSAGLSDVFRVEADAGDLFRPKQPILAERGGRFIRFDSKDSELELEFGVSVPFLKVPLPRALGAEPSEHHGSHEDHRLVINPAGLLVGATILFTSFLLVPVLFPTVSHNTNHRRVHSIMGDGGRTMHNETNHTSWALLDDMNDLLARNHLPPRPCLLKGICTVASQFLRTLPLPSSALLQPLIRYERALGADGLIDAISFESCGQTFSACILTTDHFQMIPRLLSAFK